MIFAKALILVFLLGCGNNKKLDKKACEVFENQLSLVKDFIDGRVADSSLRRVEAIAFFENLTKIESESDKGYIGKLNPTSNDYMKWSEWYKVNMDKMYWDVKKQKVLVKE